MMNRLLAAGRGVFHYPPAKGKVVEQVEFSTVSRYHNITIDFDDKTCLNFEIDTGFKMEADYSDWKIGNQEVIRAWRPVRHSEQINLYEHPRSSKRRQDGASPIL